MQFFYSNDSWFGEHKSPAFFRVTIQNYIQFFFAVTGVGTGGRGRMNANNI